MVDLVALEDRVVALENKLKLKEKDLEGQSATEKLLNIHNDLKKLQTKCEQVKEVWASYDLMKKITNLELFEKRFLPGPVKTEMVLSGEEILKKLATQMEDIEKLKEYVNTSVIQGLGEQTPKMYPLATKHTDIETEATEVSQQAHELFASYTDIITMMSKKFVYWDTVLATQEAAKKA
eukprot:m.22370 g.22370  ORF g.22370 m.22370 type:complete len:179 (+) comp7392_c0_seq1:145-681(+)